MLLHMPRSRRLRCRVLSGAAQSSFALHCYPLSPHLLLYRRPRSRQLRCWVLLVSASASDSMNLAWPLSWWASGFNQVNWYVAAQAKKQAVALLGAAGFEDKAAAMRTKKAEDEEDEQQDWVR
jgi:hypothetical protein